MTTLMDIVIGCENHLGWQPRPYPGKPGWYARSLEVMKLRKAIEQNRRRTTLPQLSLALEYSRRKRLPVSSPINLLHRIDDALALANIPAPVSDTTRRITEAIQWEKDRDDTDSLRWIHLLARACGPGREDVLTEWQAAGRG